MRNKAIKPSPVLDLELIASQTHDRISKLLDTISKSSYLSELILSRTNLKITEQITSESVSFRYQHDNVVEEDLEGINRMVLYEVWKNNVKTLTDTRVSGKYSLKTLDINCLSYLDLDILVEQVASIGEALVPGYLVEST